MKFRKTGLILSTLLLFWGMKGIVNAQKDIYPFGKKELRFKTRAIYEGDILHSATGKKVDVKEIAAALKSKKLCIIGEMHDSIKCHKFQLQLIREIFKVHKKIVVGFEFFSRKDNGILKDFINGIIDEDEMLKRTGWYSKSSYNYRYTKLILDFLKQEKIEVIGLNIPRTILRKISRKGFETLKPEEKKLFPGINRLIPEHRFFIKSIFGSIATTSPDWFNRIYTAQKCWDIVMGESMYKTLKKRKGYKGVIIAGANHVAYGLGIPARYPHAGGRKKSLTVMPVVVKSTKSEGMGKMHKVHAKMGVAQKPAYGVFGLGLGDYVYSVKEYNHPHFPEFGLSFKDGKDGVTVSRVVKGGYGWGLGITKGDIIKEVRGEKVKDAESLRKKLSRVNYGDDFSIKTEKNSVVKELNKKDF